jgi:hypothetical protein
MKKNGVAIPISEKILRSNSFVLFPYFAILIPIINPIKDEIIKDNNTISIV